MELVLVDIEDDYKAQPTRYVREAQMGLEDGTYAEVWAVFDKDWHPNHKEAFDLANKAFAGKKVNIAFTSIAFEYWILLHFEFNDTAFVKSMCRQGKEYYYCGIESHADDCIGSKCVCGRIVTAGYLSYENGKKSFDVNQYHPNVYDAISRAVLLRQSYHGETRPIYEFNPYTSMDKLISDGHYHADGPMTGGLDKSWGPTVVLRVDDMDVLVVTQPSQMLDLAEFTAFGIDPAACRVVGLKSMQHFRAAFEPIAGKVIVCDSGALCTPDYAKLPYPRVPRPIFPLDTDIDLARWRQDHAA